MQNGFLEEAILEVDLKGSVTTRFIRSRRKLYVGK
jgi:hypothetical protein